MTAIIICARRSVGASVGAEPRGFRVAHERVHVHTRAPLQPVTPVNVNVTDDDDVRVVEIECLAAQQHDVEFFRELVSLYGRRILQRDIAARALDDEACAGELD